MRKFQASWMVIMMLSVGGACLAQGPTYVVSPDTAAPGTPRTLSVTPAVTSSILVPDAACLWTTIHSGSPNGPVISSSPCPPNLSVVVQPCGFTSHALPLPGNLAPGTYFVRCDYFDTSSSTTGTRHVDFRVEGPNEAILTPADQPELGFTWTLNLSLPAHPNSLYLAGASLTTESGVALGPDFISLDPDFLFQLSIQQIPNVFFNNFSGSLDANGNATMTVFIPNLPALECFSIHAQAFLITPSNTTQVSNCVDSPIFST